MKTLRKPMVVLFILAILMSVRFAKVELLDFLTSYYYLWGIKLSFIKPLIVEEEKVLFDKAMNYHIEGKWQLSYDFCIETWRMYNETERHRFPHTVDLGSILDYAQYAAQMLEKWTEAQFLCEWCLANVNLTNLQLEAMKNWSRFYKHKVAFLRLRDIEQMPESQQHQLAQDLTDAVEYDSCTDAVASSQLKKLSEDPRYICRLDNRNSHPLLLLSPVKEEILHFDPLVVLMYNIILPSEIDKLKELASTELSQAGLFEIDKANQFNVEHRKAETAWIETLTMHQLTNRIEAYTGLNAQDDGCEMYQVGYYTIGGHYRPHVDPLEDENEIAANGDRIATLLLYLAETNKGGGTMFAEPQIRVTPVTGAGLFWYNLHRNETVDRRTLHGACPVIQGEKWIANKWFRFRGQLHQRPCGLYPEETFSLQDFNFLKKLF